MTDWKLIESAPKDEPVLVCEVSAFGPEPKSLQTVAMLDETDGFWYPVIRSEVVLHPTHWMPLPEPPSA